MRRRLQLGAKMEKRREQSTQATQSSLRLALALYRFAERESQLY